MKPKLITADNSYLKFEGTSDQAFDFIDAMAQLDASNNIHDLVFNIEVALQREGFLDEDFNRVDDTLRWEDISRDEFDMLMEKYADDIEFTDFRKKTLLNITIKETEWLLHVEDSLLLQSENITAGVTTYHKRKCDQICNSYPYEDGDTFYTIENGLVIESVWDEQAEEMHNDNPDCVYYNRHVDAVNAHKAQLLEFLSNNVRADYFKDQSNLHQSAINYITSTESTLCSNCGHDLGYGYMDCGAGIAGDCPECGHNNRQLH
jgi:hypothetical protein